MTDLRQEASLPSGWRRPLAIAVLVSGGPLMALMFAALGPVLPNMATHFNGQGGGAFIAQMVMTAPALGVIAGGALSGFVLERTGVRAALIAALAVYAAAGAAGLFLDTVWMLLAARFCVGLAVAHVSTCLVTLVGAWFAGERRARMLGAQGAVAGVVAVCALLASGALAHWAGWRSAFALYLLALPILACAIAAIPAGAARADPAARRAGAGGLVSLWPIYLLCVGLFLAYFMTSLQLTFLLAADGVTSPVVRSLVIAGGVLAGSLGGGAYGVLFGKVGSRGILLMLLALMGAGLALIGATGLLGAIAVGAALAGAGGGMINPYVSGLLLARAPPEVRSRALGLMFTFLYAADFLNPLIVTPARGVIGQHGVFLAAGALLFAGLLAAAMQRLRKPAVARTA
jgi:MFS family permease